VEKKHRAAAARTTSMISSCDRPSLQLALRYGGGVIGNLLG